MKMKSTKRKIAETAVGAGIGAAIAGPIGAVAGGLAAGHVEEGLDYVGKLKPPEAFNKLPTDDPLIHVWPKRILVPLDFSPPSRRALRFARHWADFFAAKVYLLHVVEPTATVGEFGTVPAGAIQRDIPGRAKAALSELARSEFPDSIPVHVVVRKGTAYDQIAATARGIRADLIIIANPRPYRSEACGARQHRRTGVASCTVPSPDFAPPTNHVKMDSDVI